MRNISRTTTAISAAFVTALIATPALASTSAADARTSLTARATKSVVAPRHTDTVLLTLRSTSGSKTIGVAGESSNFLVRSRHADGTAAWSAWSAVKATAASSAGHYRISVALPAKIAKGKDEQFQVKFAGDAANHLKSSRSQVFTVQAS